MYISNYKDGLNFGAMVVNGIAYDKNFFSLTAVLAIKSLEKLPRSHQGELETRHDVLMRGHITVCIQDHI